MIRTPSGKNLMNLQEAVQWLLDNNALPFQCTADYVGGAEIGLGTIVNPTPAKVRVGSLIFFADSKVSTVIAITSNSFICSDEHNDLVDDVVYVSNVQLNASGHLIVTLSNGTNIDAGLIKQVSGFSINDSQHLIVSFNNGTTTDLGAIFSGDITISGNLTVTGNITGDSIIENMSGYSFIKRTGSTNPLFEYIFAGAVKNNNKLTLALAFNLTRTDTISAAQILGEFKLPRAICDLLYPTLIGSYNVLAIGEAFVTSDGVNGAGITYQIEKDANLENVIFKFIGSTNMNDVLTLNTKFFTRIEATFLLSDNLAG